MRHLPINLIAIELELGRKGSRPRLNNERQTYTVRLLVSRAVGNASPRRHGRTARYTQSSACRSKPGRQMCCGAVAKPE